MILKISHLSKHEKLKGMTFFRRNEVKNKSMKTWTRFSKEKIWGGGE